MPQPTDLQSARPSSRPPADGQIIPQTGPLAIVGGCGHVGLPLGLAFADKGFTVHLVDTSAERVASVNQGKMPFHEDDAERLLGRVIQSGRLRATTDMDVLRTA